MGSNIRYPARILGCLVGLFVLSFLSNPPLPGQEELSPVLKVESQPLIASVKRIEEALSFLGSPLAKKDAEALHRAYKLPAEKAILGIQEVLSPRVLMSIRISPESRVKVARGPATAELFQQGWRTFLLRVHNEAGVTAPLRAESPNTAPVYKRSTGAKEPEVSIRPEQVVNRWMDIHLLDSQPLNRRLSGLELEYRIIEIFSRDVGEREARIGFNVGQGTQDIGFRNEVNILFHCLPSVSVILDVQDIDGKPTMASFIIRDQRNRIYPAPSRRLAPDFFFHPQVYRKSGESVTLTPGTYSVEYTRGPEYLVERRKIVVPEGVETHRETFHLRRWIHPLKMRWYSGDHHVHGGGCAHYESPTAGVTPEDMFRHILGEDLNVGCVLSWGPCWYFQKEFFEGKVNDLSQENHIIRYDVEVSGFPSQHAGHLCLLRLNEDDYPTTTRIEEWPSWDLPILQWGKSQGGVVGFSHSGWGLEVGTKDLPNYVIPPFDGIGANEYIVDVAHDAVDFISTVDTPYVWELNIWYHTLNCGFRARISGETDFPCIYGEKVGLGRVYCKLEGALDFDRFCQEIKNGRSYVSDGKSHILDFNANGLDVGTRGSELAMARGGDVVVRARVAALLNEEPNPALRDRPYQQKPYWDIERARIGESRTVPLELLVNGYPVEKTTIAADGTIHDIHFRVPIEKSSWIALRILPSSHTNPIFVIVEGKPIRASRRSAEWCLKSVEQCWSQKVQRIRQPERETARVAYDAATAIYRRILAECEED